MQLTKPALLLWKIKKAAGLGPRSGAVLESCVGTGGLNCVPHPSAPGALGQQQLSASLLLSERSHGVNPSGAGQFYSTATVSSSRYKRCDACQALPAAGETRGARAAAFHP